VQQPPAAPVVMPKSSPVIPFPGNRPARVSGTPARLPEAPVQRTQPRPPAEKPSQDLSDMEIPTFIRRQMD
jgi:hypothetical protein